MPAIDMTGLGIACAPFNTTSFRQAHQRVMRLHAARAPAPHGQAILRSAAALREIARPRVSSLTMPFNPEPAGRPPTTPRFVSEPSVERIANMPMVPLPPFREYRNCPSALTARCRLVDPDGLIPTTVPGSGASPPAAPMAKPAIEDEPALEHGQNARPMLGHSNNWPHPGSLRRS